MIIYKALNKINGKCYVGQSAYDLNHRIYGHIAEVNRNSAQIIHKAIRKYGMQAFEWSIIDEADSKEVLNEKEIYWIKTLNTMVPTGYNMSYGGEAGNTSERSEESNKKTSETQKGISKHTEEFKRRMSDSYKGVNNPFFGKKHSEEFRSKMSKRVVGNQFALGNKLSEETRKKMSEAHKGKRRKLHTEESKRKMSEVKMGNQYRLGKVIQHSFWGKRQYD